MLPGARYPSHHHASLVHCYVIEGDLVFEDHTLLAGDYSAGTPDKDHTAATTKNSCLLFIVHNTQDRVRSSLIELYRAVQGPPASTAPVLLPSELSRLLPQPQLGQIGRWAADFER
jgi:hypothetical protein